MQNQDEILKALLEINRSVASFTRLDELLKLILKSVLNLTHAETCDIRLIDLDTNELVIHEITPEEDSLRRISISYLFSIDMDAQLEGDLNNGHISEKIKEAFKTKKGIRLSENAALLKGEYLFSMDEELEMELNKGIILKSLKNMFETKNIPLSENITITKENNDKWVIIDKEKENIYFLNREDRKLNIFKEEDNRWNIIDGEEIYIVKKEDKQLNIYPISIGVTGWAAVDKKPILILDVTVDKRYIECIEGTKSELAVPMIYGDELVGVLNVESDRIGAFNEKDVELIEALASNAAVAIENAKLIEQHKKIIDVFERIGAKITTKPKREPVLKEITKGVYEIVSVDIPLIYLYDLEKGDFSEDVVFGDISGEWEKGCRPRSEGTGKQAIKSGKLFVIEDVKKSPNILNNFPERKGVKASAVLPLKIEGRPLGALYLHFLEKHHFADKEKTELETLANQAATIINKIGFYKEPKKKIDESKEEFAVDFKEIAKKIDEITKADILLIYLYNEEKAEFEDLIFAELSREWAIKCIPRPNGAGRKAIEEKDLVTAAHNKEPNINRFPEQKGVKLTAAYPLIVEDKILGVLYMHFLEEHRITKDEERAIRMFGAHAATVIDMTNAYENLGRHLKMREALIEIGRNITADLNLEEVAPNIAEGIKRFAPESTPNLYLYNENDITKSKFLACSKDPLEVKLGDIKLRPLEEGGVGAKVVKKVENDEEEQYIIIPDVQDPNRGGSESARNLKIKTTGCFPLKFKGRVIALVYLHFKEFHKFTKADIKTFILLSDQAAIAIENAKKLEASEEKRGQTYEELFGLELLTCLEDLEGDLTDPVYKNIMDFVADIKTDQYRGISEIYNRVLDFVEELSNIFKLPPETWEIWEKLREHEGMLYQLSGYREHFIHQVHVFLLGYWIINKIGIDRIKEKVLLSLKDKRTKRIDILKIWFLTALFHDIGYAIEKTPDITDVFLGISLGGGRRGVSNHKATSTVNSEVILSWNDNRLHLRKIMKYFYGNNEEKHTLIDNTLHDALTLHQDHGVFSALMLLNRLEGKKIGTELYIAALAIALHNKYVWKNLRKDRVFEKISFYEYPIAFLLFYCDLVQEWGRYIKEEVENEYENPKFGGIVLDTTHPPKEDIICKLIYEKYLFSWDNVTGNDKDKDKEVLNKFFRSELGIAWTENVKIHKSDDGKTIRIFKDKNSAEMMIDERKGKVILRNSDDRTYNLKVKKENGKLKIYYLKIPEQGDLNNIFEPILRNWSSDGRYRFGIFYFEDTNNPPVYHSFID